MTRILISIENLSKKEGLIINYALISAAQRTLQKKNSVLPNYTLSRFLADMLNSRKFIFKIQLQPTTKLVLHHSIAKSNELQWNVGMHIKLMNIERYIMYTLKNIFWELDSSYMSHRKYLWSCEEQCIYLKFYIKTFSIRKAIKRTIILIHWHILHDNENAPQSILFSYIFGLY